MSTAPIQPPFREGACRRGRLVLATLALGSLVPALAVALGPAGDFPPGLRWTFLLAAPLLGALFLLAASFETAACGTPPPPTFILTLAGTLVLTYALGLALPTLVFQRLSPATGRLVELSRRPIEELSRRAMTAQDPRLRLEAALGLYLRTGRPSMFLDLSGSPAIYRPDGREADRLRFPRWLASRPGALPGERRTLALADTLLILGLLAALPLVIRRASARRPLLQPGQEQDQGRKL